MTASPKVKLLGELARVVTGARMLNDDGAVITSIAADSREVTSGALFVALRGRSGDGHAFVRDAVRRGASAVVVEDVVDVDVPQLVVASSRAALAPIAAAFFGEPAKRLRLIGVTGTDGKSTTSHLLAHILRESGRTVGALGSLGATLDGRSVASTSGLTTPLAHHVQALLADMAASGAQDMIIEASSMGLAEHRVDAIDFEAAVVTNISEEHVEQHGGMDHYVSAKTGLVDRVAPGGLIVGNADDAAVRGLLAAAHDVHLSTFGIESTSADVRAEDVNLVRSASTFRLRTPEGDAVVRLPLPGRFNVANALAAAAVAQGLGVGMGSIVTALSQAPPVLGRMVAIEEGQPFAVYVDYAHTLAAVRTVLEHLRAQHPQARLIAVFGTGLVADYWKRPLMAKTLVTHSDLAVFTASDHTYDEPEVVIGQYLEGAAEVGAMLGRDVLCEPDRRAAIQLAVSAAGPGDVVAILGKGHESTIVIKGHRSAWSEEAEARAAVRSALSSAG